MELNTTEASNATNGSTYDALWYLKYEYPAALAIDKYVTPIIVVVGLMGNILSFIVWMQRRMRNSSGYYLAALALNDLIFLILHIIFEIHTTWEEKVLNHPFVCEFYPIISLAPQYISLFFVLGFTTERYISICHPFKREKYCTIKRAKIVIACLTFAMLCLAAPHGYFYTLDTKNVSGTIEYDCNLREHVQEGNASSIYNIYNLCVEVLAFFIVPIAVLVLNIFVIRELRRLSQTEQSTQGSPQRTAATTLMLLAVSFYHIITTLPVTVVYALNLEFYINPSDFEKSEPRAVKIHFTYLLTLSILKEYGITHYAFNFFIYVITGKMFRQELKKLFIKPFSKLALSLPTNYTSLRTSVRATELSRNWTCTNGNNHSVKNGNNGETLL
ncbi:FMRFamide receptor-like [Physella acuta]|uniref:FMRFamide receptor-like n=1 Tax=Physella acuta TaxID=109671 RepID=UPI0027DCB960|nr:FMRFamide receptor-like [Physella acuta]